MVDLVMMSACRIEMRGLPHDRHACYSRFSWLLKSQAEVMGRIAQTVRAAHAEYAAASGTVPAPAGAADGTLPADQPQPPAPELLHKATPSRVLLEKLVEGVMASPAVQDLTAAVQARRQRPLKSDGLDEGEAGNREAAAKAKAAAAQRRRRAAKKAGGDGTGGDGQDADASLAPGGTKVRRRKARSVSVEPGEGPAAKEGAAAGGEGSSDEQGAAARKRSGVRGRPGGQGGITRRPGHLSAAAEQQCAALGPVAVCALEAWRAASIGAWRVSRRAAGRQAPLIGKSTAEALSSRFPAPDTLNALQALRACGVVINQGVQGTMQDMPVQVSQECERCFQGPRPPAKNTPSVSFAALEAAIRSLLVKQLAPKASQPSPAKAGQGAATAQPGDAVSAEVMQACKEVLGKLWHQADGAVGEGTVGTLQPPPSSGGGTAAVPVSGSSTTGSVVLEVGPPAASPPSELVAAVLSAMLGRQVQLGVTGFTLTPPVAQQRTWPPVSLSVALTPHPLLLLKQPGQGQPATAAVSPSKALTAAKPGAAADAVASTLQLARALQADAEQLIDVPAASGWAASGEHAPWRVGADTALRSAAEARCLARATQVGQSLSSEASQGGSGVAAALPADVQALLALVRGQPQQGVTLLAAAQALHASVKEVHPAPSPSSPPPAALRRAALAAACLLQHGLLRCVPAYSEGRLMASEHCQSAFAYGPRLRSWQGQQPGSSPGEDEEGEVWLAPWLDLTGQLNPTALKLHVERALYEVERSPGAPEGVLAQGIATGAPASTRRLLRLMAAQGLVKVVPVQVTSTSSSAQAEVGGSGSAAVTTAAGQMQPRHPLLLRRQPCSRVEGQQRHDGSVVPPEMLHYFKAPAVVNAQAAAELRVDMLV
jgi:hypothetical protein